MEQKTLKMKQQAQIFKALGDETRLRILLLLLRNGELCVCDLEAALDAPQSTVSRHLTTLRSAFLVEGERHGVWMHYRIAGDNGIKSAVLDAVRKYCQGLEQDHEDEQRLAYFLKTKTKTTCNA